MFEITVRFKSEQVFLDTFYSEEKFIAGLQAQTEWVIKEAGAEEGRKNVVIDENMVTKG